MAEATNRANNQASDFSGRGDQRHAGRNSGNIGQGRGASTVVASGNNTAGMAAVPRACRLNLNDVFILRGTT